MTRIVLALSLASFATGAFGETFECRDPAKDENSDVLVVATVSNDKKFGTIEVAGVKYETDFSVSGFDREWAWNDSDGDPWFKFSIQPDGTGLYYAGQFIWPEQEFTCRKR